MKILYIAEIVGKAGVYAYKKGLALLRQQRSFDFVITCADGATGGNGLGRNHAAYIRKLGTQVITTGECCFYKKDLVENLEKTPYVLRPENLNPAAPGFGSRIFKIGERKIGVAVLLGQSGFTRLHGDNPFSALPILVERLRQETPHVIIDFHAEATAEKRTLFALAAGHCSAVIGSHNRVQTADAAVLAGGTAVITDTGRTGSVDSVGGNDKASRIQEYISGIPEWTRDAWDRCELQGVLIDIDDRGKAVSIERIRQPVPDAEGGEKKTGDASPETSGGERA
ncbi:MAG: YmdB family metallophosphoesterase [Treponema sp.]|jgi:metallophosphoesterase (TIGR00282 family)|nr:YmdB family metallophosphoesterase [Treponema sp.]